MRDFQAHERIRPCLSAGKVEGVQVARVEYLAPEKAPRAQLVKDHDAIEIRDVTGRLPVGVGDGANAVPAARSSTYPFCPSTATTFCPSSANTDDTSRGHEGAPWQAGLIGVELVERAARHGKHAGSGRGVQPTHRPIRQRGPQT